MDYQAEKALIKAVIGKYPDTFGLRSYQGDTFKICPRDSYHNDHALQVVIHRLEQGEWKSFTRCTEAELAFEVFTGV